MTMCRMQCVTCAAGSFRPRQVEVLEARALRGDWLSKADAYALLVFEGCAAKTNIVQNHDNPGWGAKSSYRVSMRTHPARS